MSIMMHVDIVSLEKQIFSGQAEAIFVTGTLGELGIYPGHTQLLSSLKPGQVRVQLSNKHEEVYYISGGILEVQPGIATILSDTAVRATDLDEAAVLATKERTEKLIASKQTDFDYSRATAELAEALAQLRAIQNIKKKIR
ncbi:MAG: F0F1 ATP synthase subunit epsilon [Gammaproteobacteria bacterium]